MYAKNDLRLSLFFLLCCIIGHPTAVWSEQAKPPSQSKRFVTVADSIRMATIDNPNYSLGTWGRDDVAAFSPDGKRFVIILKKGNLEQNTVDYSLLLFQTDSVLSSPSAELLATLSSSSPRPAIDSLTWLDNQRIAFLGENDGDHHQLYVVDCASKRLQKVTSHPTDLVNYAFNRTGDIFFTAAKPAELLRRNGNRVIIDHENLYQLISGEQVGVLAGLDLFVVRNEGGPVPLTINGNIQGLSKPWPSPDGHYLAIQTIATRVNVPIDWYSYQTVAEQTILSKQGPSSVNQYELLNLMTGENRPLVDAPVGAWYSNLAWSDDSRSVLISGTDLPLDVRDGAERKLRESNLFVAEVEIPSSRVIAITHQDSIIRHFNSRTNELVLQLTSHQSFSNFEEGEVVRFRKTGEGWKRQNVPPAIDEKDSSKIEIAVEEDMNTPPRLFARDLETRTKTLLLDPNPQFGELRFGRVEQIDCKSADGHAVTAGLYRPPDYVSGKKYPLVIQTHGWTSDRFWIDGPDTTAFAAQALAAKGFVVVQLGDDFTSGLVTPPYKGKGAAMAEVEGVIDHLDRTGLIDPNRIGIVAFSATGTGVGYAIVHSKYHFGAAVLAETDDAGYFTYLSLYNLGTGHVAQFEGINGGIPFGTGLALWLREAPEFSLDKVSTAMLLQANSRFSVLPLWEWFVGFRRLGKPVEMVLMPNADHVATRPEDRLLSQEGAVDWFDFWLNTHEDRAPAKAEQYARWRELRKLQDANEKKTRE